MERNMRMQRKSLSLGNRINRRPSAPIALPDDTITSPSTLLCPSPSESTPPHKTFSLDESMEFSPTCLNNSFSPSTLQSQAFENSEVCWKWSQKENNNEHVLISDSVLTECSFTTPETKTKQLPKRQQFLKDIESKIRKAENTRADEMLKRRCAKFREKLLGNENLTPDEYIQKTTKEEQKSVKSSTVTAVDGIEKTPFNNTTIPRNTIDDFFNDSDTDDFLLEATEQVEHEHLTQKFTLTANDLTTPKRIQNHEEKRSSIYKKFLEDDMSDDFFGCLDDIIENAMKDTRPKSSFQRFNSLPVESNSPRSTKSKTSTKIVEIAKNAQINSKSDSPNFKRHASCHDVPIYYPHKPKQARRT